MRTMWAIRVRRARVRAVRAARDWPRALGCATPRSAVRTAMRFRLLLLRGRRPPPLGDAQLNQGDDEEDDEEEQGDRGAVADLHLLKEGIKDQVSDRLRLARRAAPGHREDRVEDLEGAQDGDDREEEDGRLEERGDDARRD